MPLDPSSTACFATRGVAAFRHEVDRGERSTMQRRTILAAASLAALVAGTASAETSPSRPITMVVPFAAGGPTDTVARLIAEPMTKTLGQQVIVENVGGAGG